MSVLTKLKSRGYWQTEIRADQYDPQRVGITDLASIVRQKRVEFRGWDFPHLGPRGPQLYEDYVGQEANALGHVEAWRFYKSGQFVHFGAVRLDWIEDHPTWSAQDKGQTKPHSSLSVEDTVALFQEIYRFAAGLASTAAWSESATVSVTLHGAAGRRMLSDHSRSHLVGERRSSESAEPIRHLRQLSREDALSNFQTAAFSGARDIFRRFGNWDPGDDVLREFLSELPNAGAHRRSRGDSNPFSRENLKRGHDPYRPRDDDYNPIEDF